MKLSERMRSKPAILMADNRMIFMENIVRGWADEVAQLEAENERLRGFWNELCAQMWEYWELDGADFQDMGEKFGLLVKDVYDPEGKHKDMIIVDVGPGDKFWLNVYALEAGR